MKITDGKTVIIDYTLSLNSGDVIETTRDEEPLTYIQGSGELIDGLEQAVAGMEKGAKKDIVLPVAQAFGEHDPEALLEIPKNSCRRKHLSRKPSSMPKAPRGKALTARCWR
jgi:FKBP-type peptidyl-prolyl cis-trans isomerase 2